MVPMADLKKQYHSIKQEVDAAIGRVLESSQYVLGSCVEEFESAFAAVCGVPYGIGVNSGTSALHLALLAAGIKAGDEVITSPFTFIATAMAIEYVGARPVFVDIEPDTFTLDWRKVETAITPGTKALLPVHLFGQPADMDPLLEIAKRRGLVLIEDACQAHLSAYKGRPVGSLGDLACFSFYPGKNLGACGEGGIVVTSRDDFARKIRALRDWGQEKRYIHRYKGFNYRMEGIQGAILNVKLKHLPAWTEARVGHAKHYGELLAGTGLELPRVAPGRTHVYHVYAVRHPKRDALQAHLAGAKIQTGIHYPLPIHLQPCFAELGHKEGAFPVAERCAREVLSLPLYAEMSGEQVAEVAGAVRVFANNA